MTEKLKPLNDGDLLPCPFCGSEKVYRTPRTKRVYCISCHSTGTNKEVWSTRHLSAADLSQQERDAIGAEYIEAVAKSGRFDWVTSGLLSEAAKLRGGE